MRPSAVADRCASRKKRRRQQRSQSPWLEARSKQHGAATDDHRELGTKCVGKALAVIEELACHGQMILDGEWSDASARALHVAHHKLFSRESRWLCIALPGAGLNTLHLPEWSARFSPQVLARFTPSSSRIHSPSGAGMMPARATLHGTPNCPCVLSIAEECQSSNATNGRGTSKKTCGCGCELALAHPHTAPSNAAIDIVLF